MTYQKQLLTIVYQFLGAWLRGRFLAKLQELGVLEFPPPVNTAVDSVVEIISTSGAEQDEPEVEA